MFATDPAITIAVAICPSSTVTCATTSLTAMIETEGKAANSARVIFASDPLASFIVIVAARLCGAARRVFGSEEHTSELQSLMRISYAVFCLNQNNIIVTTQHLLHCTSHHLP